MDSGLIDYLSQIVRDLRESFDAYEAGETAEECDVAMIRLRGAIEELEGLIATLKQA